MRIFIEWAVARLPIFCARHSAGQKRHFERKEERQKVSASLTGKVRPPEVCEKISATMTKLCADPDERQRKSERAKESHRRRSEAQKRRQVRERAEREAQRNNVEIPLNFH